MQRCPKCKAANGERAKGACGYFHTSNTCPMRCGGCENGYPRAWAMDNKRWEHCNCGIYFPCTKNDPPPEELRPKVKRDNSVTNYSDANLVARVMRNLNSHKRGGVARWIVVMEVFALGSTFAHELCEIHHLDPDEKV